MILFAIAVMPAYAHDPVLSGRTVCTNGEHHVSWTIGNDWDLPMALTSVNARVGSTEYPVSMAIAVVPPLGEIPASSVVPGPVTGNIVLSVTTRWTDGFTGSGSTFVRLISPCNQPPMTTTTAPPVTTAPTTAPPVTTAPTTAPPVTTSPTTEAPVTTTSIDSPVTTSGGPVTTTTIESSVTTAGQPVTSTTADISQGSTTPDSDGSGINVPVTQAGGPGTPGDDSPAEQLPFTGNGPFWPMLGLGSLLAGGIALAYGRKRRHTTG
jgi:hypothetical protein